MAKENKQVLRKITTTAFKVLIPMAIGGGLIIWLFGNFDFNQMKSMLTSDSFHPQWILAALIISIFSHIFRALRWRLQLRALNVHPPLSALVNSIFGTYAVNLIFPRAGEVWRTTYIANRQKASFTTVLGSMVGDRLSDTFTVLALTILTFFLAQDAIQAFLDQYHLTAGLMATLTSWKLWACIAVAIAFLVWLFTGKTQNGIVVKVRTMVKNLWDGFSVIARMEGKWMFLFYTICIWGCYFSQLYVATFAFDYTADLGIIATLVLFVLSSIGMGVPTNGGLGAWHIAIIFGLSLYGIGAPFNPNNLNPDAQIFAMTVWGAQTLLLIALGIYAFIYMEIDRRNIKSGKTQVITSGDGMQL